MGRAARRGRVAEQLRPRARTRPALPHPRRPVEEVRVREPLRQRRAQQPLGLLLLRKRAEALRGRARPPPPPIRSRRSRRSAPGTAPPARGRRRRRARGRRRLRARSGRARGRSLRVATLGSTSSRNVRSGSTPCDGRQVELEHALEAEPARDPLVGERGVDVAVAEHVRAALARRQDHALDELRPRGGEERRLRPRRHVRPVQQELADPLAEVGAARLTGDDDLAPGLLEVARRAARPASSCRSRRAPRRSGTSRPRIRALSPPREPARTRPGSPGR